MTTQTPDPQALGLDYQIYPSGVPSVDFTYTPDAGCQSGNLLPTDFQQKAKEAVALYYNRVIHEDRDMVLPSDVFVVWFSKVLQNWKVMCSTVFPDGRYFELTYNGDKRELYVDEYVKKGNQVFLEGPDEMAVAEHPYG